MRRGRREPCRVDSAVIQSRWFPLQIKTIFLNPLNGEGEKMNLVLLMMLHFPFLVAFSHGTSSEVHAVPSADHLSNSGNRLDNHVAQDTAGQSDSLSFSESLKSRFSNISLRCKESFTKNTRGWKERLFSRSNPVPMLGPEVQREVNVDIPTTSRKIDHIETEESCTSGGSASVSLATQSVSETSDNRVTGNPIHDTEDDEDLMFYQAQVELLA